MRAGKPRPYGHFSGLDYRNVYLIFIKFAVQNVVRTELFSMKRCAYLSKILLVAAWVI